MPGGGGRAPVARDFAYRSKELEEALVECCIALVIKHSMQHGERQCIEICFSSLKKRVSGLGETLAETPVGLTTRIAAKMAAYTYGFYVNRLLGRPQGQIKEL